MPHGASASVAYFGFIDTRMVQDSFEDPLAKRFEGHLPKFATRRLQPDAAGAAIVAGLEKRAPRIVAPRWWAIGSAFRGLMNPLLDRQMEGDPKLRALLRRARAPPRGRARRPGDRLAAQLLEQEETDS